MSIKEKSRSSRKSTGPVTRAVCLALLSMVWLLAAPALGAEWKKQLLSDEPDLTAPWGWVDLKLDGADRPHLAYDYQSGAKSGLGYQYWNGEQWVNDWIDRDFGYSRDVRLHLDGTDTPMLVDDNWHKVRALNLNADHWDQEIIHDNGDRENPFDVAFQGDTVHICHGDPHLHYRVFDGSEWKTEQIADNAQGYRCRIAVDSQGRPHIAYFKSDQIHYTYLDGDDQWQQPVQPSDQWFTGDHELALDAGDAPHLLHDSGDHRNLIHTYWDGAQWQSDYLFNSGGDYIQAGVMELAFGPSGQIHVLFLTSGVERLRYGHEDAGTWSFEEIHTYWADINFDGALFVDGDNTPHVAYPIQRNDAEPGHLVYAKRLENPEQADLAVTKTRVGTDPLASGDTVTYEVTVTNHGPDGPVHAQLTDSVNAGGDVVLISGSSSGGADTCESGRNTLTCVLDNIGIGQSRVITVEVTTSGGFAGTLGNSAVAAVSGYAVDPVPANDSASLDVSVTAPSPDLQRELVAYYPLDGGFTDHVGVNHGAPSGGITIQPGLNGNAAFFDGIDGYLALPRMVEENFSIGFWINTSQIGASGSSSWQGHAIVGADVCGHPANGDWDLSLINGGHIGFWEGIGDTEVNDGEWHAVVFTRDMVTGTRRLYVDGNTALIDASEHAFWRIPLAGPTEIGVANSPCNKANDTRWFQGAIDELRFYSRVLSAEEVQDLMDASLPHADLSVTKTRIGAGEVLSGDTVSFEVTVTNNGPDGPVSAQLTDTLTPANAFDTLTVTPEDVLDSCSINANVITCDLVNVLVGQSRKVTVEVNSADDFASNMTNEATVAPTGDAQDANAANDTADVEVTVVAPAPGVAVDKTGPATVTAGSTFNYLIDWRNQGQHTAEGVQLVDELPSDATFVAADDDPVYDAENHRLTWALGDIAAALQDTIQVTVRAKGGLAEGTVLINRVEISTTTPNDPIDDNLDEVSTTIVAPPQSNPDVLLSTEVFGAPAEVTDEIVYNVVIENTGNTNLFPSVKTPFPKATEYAAGSVDTNGWGGQLNIGADQITWTDIGPVKPGETAALTYKVQVVECEGTACNETEFSALVEFRDNPGLNTRLPDRVVIRCPNVSIQLSGDGVDTAHYLNKALPKPAKATLIHNLPPGGIAAAVELRNVVLTVEHGFGEMEIREDPNFPATDNDGSGFEWNLGNLAPGQSKEVPFYVFANTFDPDGDTVTAYFHASNDKHCVRANIVDKDVHNYETSLDQGGAVYQIVTGDYGSEYGSDSIYGSEGGVYPSFIGRFSFRHSDPKVLRLRDLDPAGRFVITDSLQSGNTRYYKDKHSKHVADLVWQPNHYFGGDGYWDGSVNVIPAADALKKGETGFVSLETYCYVSV